MEKKLTLTVAETAEQLNIQLTTAYRIVKKEGFPMFKLGNRILVSTAGLKQWVDMQVKMQSESEYSCA